MPEHRRGDHRGQGGHDRHDSDHPAQGVLRLAGDHHQDETAQRDRLADDHQAQQAALGGGGPPQAQDEETSTATPIR
nr:hypothetical protein GCM10020093_052820 [Planobispora longispora]